MDDLYAVQETLFSKQWPDLGTKFNDWDGSADTDPAAFSPKSTAIVAVSEVMS
jgi:hypothetical protein